MTSDQRTQVRGGTGVFTGKPAYVWISNQIGNTGVLTGFIQDENVTTRPFNPNPDFYKPATVTGAPAASVELGRHRSGLQVPADLAHQHRRRPQAAVGDDRHRRVHLQPRRERRLLHQRQPAGRAVGLRRRRQPPALEREHPARRRRRAVRHATQQRRGQPDHQRDRAEESECRPVVEPRRQPAQDARGRAWSFKAAYSYGESRNTDRSRLDRRRVVHRATR